jgi:4'-phosphopantetheinyl transferase
MTYCNIFTEDLIEISDTCILNNTDIGLNKPVIYMVLTDSYSSDAMSSFRKLLSAGELEKALRFRFIQDQRRYIVTHAILRIILGGYLNSMPNKIEFISNDYGKPSLPEKFKKIHFNLSHSKGLSALVFSTKSEIGIDVEKIDPEFDFDLIANTHFSNAENNFILAENGQSRKRFYTLWTRKEALLKAVGTGIGENLGIEVFEKTNHCKPEIPFPKVQDGDFYLKSFIFQQKYMISTASNNSDELSYSLVDLEVG